jgi:hypothetical protein
MSQHFGSDLPEDVDEYADADLLGDPSPEEEDEVASTNLGYELQEAPDSLFPRGDESTEEEDIVFGTKRGFPCQFRTQMKYDYAAGKYNAVFLELAHPVVGAKLGKKEAVTVFAAEDSSKTPTGDSLRPKEPRNLIWKTKQGGGSR